MAESQRREPPSAAPDAPAEDEPPIDVPPADEPPEEAPPVEIVSTPRDGLGEVVETNSALATLSTSIRSGRGPIAIDAERASGFRYGQSAYLVQLRRDGSGTGLIDPRPFGTLEPLGAAINGEEWILHAAAQDLPCLAELGLAPARIFDTELGARLLGLPRVGLSAVLEEFLGVGLAKEHSAADWSKRPLPESWLVYAALDVELLIELRHAMAERLQAVGKLAWAEQEFEHVRLHSQVRPREDPWRRTRALSSVRGRRAYAVARELWYAREELARTRDRSPRRVLVDEAVIAAARAMPKTLEALRSIPGFASAGQVRLGPLWLAAIERALRLEDDELPALVLRTNGPPAARNWARSHPEAAARLARVRACVQERAATFDLPPENLLAPVVQRELAWEVLESADASDVADRLARSGAREWQIDIVTDSLCAALTADA